MSHKHRYSDLAYWKWLTERYFDAETTPEEERELCRFLASPEGQQPQFDDVRHVMGYLITGRRHTSRPPRQPRPAACGCPAWPLPPLWPPC